MQRAWSAALTLGLALALLIPFTGGFVYLCPPSLLWVGKHPLGHRLLVMVPFLLWLLLWRLGPSGAWNEGLSRLLGSHAGKLAMLLVAAYALTMGAAAHLRHWVFQTSFDMAVFDQALWNSTRGRVLFSSIKGGISILGDHFSPLLFAYVPLYFLWDNAAVILWAQALIGTASLWMVYRMACDRTQDGGIGLAFAVAFFLYLPMRNALRFDFHPEVLSDMLWLGALWALWRKNMPLFLSACGLAVLGKENMWGIAAAMGAYLFIFEKRRALGAAFVLVSVAMFFLAIHVFVPAIGGRPYLYIGNFSAMFDQARLLPSAGTLLYLTKIFLPVGLLSFLSPATMLLALPVLGQNLLSKNPFMTAIFFQYSLGLTCFVFAAAIEGLGRFARGESWVQRWFPKAASRATAKGLAIWMVLAAFAMSGVGEGHLLGSLWKENSPAKAGLRNALARIPQEASVWTHEFYAPHLAHRQEIFLRESKEAAGVNPYGVDYAVLDEQRLGEEAASVVDGFLQEGYEMLFDQGPYKVLKRPAS